MGSATSRRTAGAFDVRYIIGALLGAYGIVLTILGLTSYDAAQAAKTGDVNVNLWAGLAMVAVALLMALWGHHDPIYIDEPHHQGAASGREDAPADH